MLEKGRLNMVIDGQFGSTGKGVIAGYAAKKHAMDTGEPLDWAITNASPNAGHTVDYNDGKGKQICFHLPVSALFDKRTSIYLCAGSIINPEILKKEMKTFGVEPGRIFIHPHAAVVLPEHIEAEGQSDSSATKIASTQKGVGTALAAKIMRKGNVAKNDPFLQKMVAEIPVDVMLWNNPETTVLMEVPQGFNLGVNTGFYPYTTSREVSVQQALSDVQVNHHYLGSVILSLRTFPIRVGNIVEDGKEIGQSGPFFDDSVETTWEELGFEAERTTVTQRIRRIATFSMKQYEMATRRLCPTHVFLNFANYLEPRNLDILLDEINEMRPITHLGFGPTCNDVKEYQA